MSISRYHDSCVHNCLILITGGGYNMSYIHAWCSIYVYRHIGGKAQVMCGVFLRKNARCGARKAVDGAAPNCEELTNNFFLNRNFNKGSVKKKLWLLWCSEIRRCSSGNPTMLFSIYANGEA